MSVLWHLRFGFASGLLFPPAVLLIIGIANYSDSMPYERFSNSPWNMTLMIFSRAV